MIRALVSAACLLAVLFACKSVTSGVQWEPKPDIPQLGSRGDGCYIEFYEVGREPERPYKVVGKLVLDLNRDQVQNGGGADVSRRFREAGCEYGVFLIKDVKTYPEPTSGRILYEATAAVWVDKDGNPILQNSQKPANDAAKGDGGTPAADAPADAAPADEAASP